jgi:hypothetical protein
VGKLARTLGFAQVDERARATGSSVFGQSDGRLAITGHGAIFGSVSGTRDKSGFGPRTSLAMRGFAEPRRARAQRADGADELAAELESSGIVVESEAHRREVGEAGEAGIQSALAPWRPALSECLLTGTA